MNTSDLGAPEAVRSLYAEITGLRGSVLNLYRALANQPPALRAFMHMSRYVRDESTLSARLRELAILATAYALDVPYEQVQHRAAARRIGVPDGQLAAFPNWASADVFDATERAVLAFADQIARRRDVDDATFEAVRRRLSLPELIDLVVVISWYHFCAAIIGPLRIEPEDAGRGAG